MFVVLPSERGRGVSVCRFFICFLQENGQFSPQKGAFPNIFPSFLCRKSLSIFSKRSSLATQRSAFHRLIHTSVSPMINWIHVVKKTLLVCPCARLQSHFVPWKGVRFWLQSNTPCEFFFCLSAYGINLIRASSNFSRNFVNNVRWCAYTAEKKLSTSTNPYPLRCLVVLR